MTPYTRHIITTNRTDHITPKTMSYNPLPNQDPNPITHLNNFFLQGIGESSTLPQFDIKGDHSITDRLRFTGRYSVSWNKGTGVNLFGLTDPALSAADPWSGPSSTHTQSAAGNLTFAQNPSTVWTLNYGLIYSNYHRDPFVSTFDSTSLGLPQYMQDTATLNVFPTFSAGGYNDIGTQGYWKMDRQEGVHQFSSSMTKMIGGHNI